VTVHYDAAVAVEDAAARRQQGNALDAVLLRPSLVELGVLNQKPEIRNRKIPTVEY
jgi:hypothetical protein